MKVFISHSSVDKPFATEMIESIGRDSVTFDQYSFEPGEDLNENIVNSINECDIFVLLISNDSLNSPWVQKEIGLASKLMLTRDLIFLPYSIDSSVKPLDKRIEEWVWTKLVKHFEYPKLMARAIQRKINDLIALRFPDIKSMEDLFIGRNLDMGNLEHDFYREDLSHLKTIFISGFPFIGRKTIFKRFIQQYIKKNASYRPVTIRLSNTDSIEQFAIYLNEQVGLKKSNSIIDEVSKGKKYTLDLCSKLLLTLIDYNEKLVIEDDACIVKAGGAIIDWFLDLTHMPSLPSEVVFFVASRYRPNPSFVSESPLMMEYAMTTLHKEDMYSLFKHCLAIHKQQLDEELVSSYVDCFTGYPKQAIDAAEIVHKNTELLAKKKIGRIKESYDGNYAPIWDELTVECRDLLVLLSKFDFISTQLLLNIYSGKDLTPLLEELEPFSLFESFGKTNEYICLCPAFADYIARSRYKMSPVFAKTYNKATKTMLAEIDSELTDISSRLYSIKELIRSNPKGIDDRYLVPSFVLKVIVEEYHLNHDDIVVEIASRIIKDYKKANYDSCINAIHYWLCCSLCRLQNRDAFEKEIVFFENDPFDYNYLYGFYFRHGHKRDRLRKAKDYYSQAMEIKNGRSYLTHTSIAKVEHELVIVLMKLRDFKGALNSAKVNYQNNHHNSYHIRAYYNCLIHTYDFKKEDLIELLNAMKQQGVRANTQFVPTMQAQYTYYVDKDFIGCVRAFRHIFEKGLNEGKLYAADAFRDICTERGSSQMYDEIVKGVDINELDE